MTTFDVAGVPAALREVPQWIVWRLTERAGKPDKPPFDHRTGRPGDVRDPAIHMAFSMAVGVVEAQRYEGIGFAFTPADPFCGVDLDDCFDADGVLEPWADRIVSGLLSYTEWSPSGKGLHVIVRGRLPEASRHKLTGLGAEGKGSVEYYDRARYFTVTGDHFEGTPLEIEDRQEELTAFHREAFPPEPRRNGKADPRPHDLSDDAILDRARKAGNGERFSALFDRGDTGAHHGDDSRADLALCSHLAFWAGGAVDVMDRLFRRSALYRPKWDEMRGVRTYGERTILRALEGMRGFYEPHRNGKARANGQVPPEAATCTASGSGRPADDETPIVVREWPEPPGAEVYHGLAGQLVHALEPHTESDPLAILVQLLVAFGNMAGRSAFFAVEADRHYPNLFIALVGPSSKARKGTSWGHARRLLKSVDPTWAETRIVGGLSSGEGLIYAVRDPVYKREPIRAGKTGPITGYENVLVDPGEEDKRILALEPELASVLRAMARDGNTLSALLRRAWDDGNLRTLIKNSPNVSTEAHASIIGHITKDELQKLLTGTEAANGFGNRFIWICVRRSKLLPFGGLAHQLDFAPLLRQLVAVAEVARTRGEVARDGAADELWLEAYRELSEGQPGLLGAILGRAEAQVMRLALVYALLDGSGEIGRPHLEAALALWRYAEDSARYVFGDALGDEDAEAILAALRAAPEGLARSRISVEVFSKNKTAVEITRALSRLLEAGLVRRDSIKTGGRPAETWFATCGGER